MTYSKIKSLLFDILACMQKRKFTKLFFGTQLSLFESRSFRPIGKPAQSFSAGMINVPLELISSHLTVRFLRLSFDSLIDGRLDILLGSLFFQFVFIFRKECKILSLLPHLPRYRSSRTILCSVVCRRQRTHSVFVDNSLLIILLIKLSKFIKYNEVKSIFYE